jgi:hypothetical protein
VSLSYQHRDARLEHLRGLVGAKIQILGAINDVVGGRRFRPEGDWQPGTLVSIDVAKNTALIRHEDVWVDEQATELLEETVPLSYIRPFPPPSPAFWTPSRGEILGVTLLDKEKDPHTGKQEKPRIWWHCKVMEIPKENNNLFVVARPDGIEEISVSKSDLYPGLTWIKGTEVVNSVWLTVRLSSHYHVWLCKADDVLSFFLPSLVFYWVPWCFSCANSGLVKWMKKVCLPLRLHL